MEKADKPRLVVRIIILLIVVSLIIGAALMWQKSTDRQQAAIDSETFKTFINPSGELVFKVPNEWKLDDNSQLEDGITSIQLNGPKNETLHNVIDLKTGQDSADIAEAIKNFNLQKLIGINLSKELAIIQFDIYSGLYIELSTDKQIWKEQLPTTTNVANGISFGKFEDFSVEGGDGYKYTTTIFENGESLSAINYYLLGDLAEVEITLFPADSSYRQQAEDIIKTMVIGTTPDNSTN